MTPRWSRSRGKDEAPEPGEAGSAPGVGAPENDPGGELEPGPEETLGAQLEPGPEETPGAQPEPALRWTLRGPVRPDPVEVSGEPLEPGASEALGPRVDAYETAADPEVSLDSHGTEPVLEPETGPPATAPVAAEETTAPDETLRELAEMAEGLLAQASDLRRQTQELAAELSAGDEDDEHEHGGSRPAAEREEVSGMRIVAVSMAAAGRSREEAERYLHDQFGEPPDPALLDEVFPP